MRQFLWAALSVTVIGSAYGSERSAEEIREARQTTIDEILSSAPAADVEIDRNNCMAGAMPRIIRISREHDDGLSPNPADLCVATLIRTTRLGALTEPYARLVAKLGGDPSAAEGLPAAIGGALVTDGRSSVSVGNGRAMKLDPAVSFDAGFAAAALKGETSAPGMPDLQTLKAISETCLDNAQDRLALCYAAGFAHGVRANLGLEIVAD